MSDIVLEDAPVPVPDTLGSTDLYNKHVKDLYCLPESHIDRWSEFDDFGESRELEERMDKYDIVHRWNLEDVRESASVTIRGEPYKVLRMFMEEYGYAHPEVDLSGSEITFFNYYPPFGDMWSELEDYRETIKDPKRREIATLLLTVFDTALSGCIGHEKFACHGDLHQDFKTGEIMVMDSGGITSAHYLREFSHQSDENEWTAVLECIDWNGSFFCFKSTRVNIPYYEGKKPINSFAVCPLKYRYDCRSLEVSLPARGRKFEALRGSHHKYCDGLRSYEYSVGQATTRGNKPVRGTVVIDAHAFYEFQGLSRPDEKRIDHELSGRRRDHLPMSARTYANAGDKSKEQHSIPNAKLRRNEVDQPLTKEQCVVAHTHVKGMDLNTKEWGQFYVDDLTDIDWELKTFKPFVLPGSVAESLIVAPNSNKLPDVDIDEGPCIDRSLTCLAFGPPGTGKTFYAKAVAWTRHKPLYALTAVEMGSDPGTVRKALDMACNCCARWKAVLVLDEADMLLAKQTPGEWQRNELVSFFLRKLDNHQGIMFLTTNRIGSIDAAVQSRIHIMLPFPPLNSKTRGEVWRGFIEANGGPDRFDVDTATYLELSALDLDKREIKNIIKIGLLGNNGLQTKVTGDSLFQQAKFLIAAQQSLEAGVFTDRMMDGVFDRFC